jgi:GGDEF domain-containing protein
MSRDKDPPVGKMMLDKKQIAIIEHGIKAEKDSLTDFKTGLPNDRAFALKMEQLEKSTHLIIVMGFVDVDLLKPTNDFFGHNFGDTAIQNTATAIKHITHPSDFVARIGGDELGFILSFNQQQTEKSYNDHCQLLQNSDPNGTFPTLEEFIESNIMKRIGQAQKKVDQENELPVIFSYGVATSIPDPTRQPPHNLNTIHVIADQRMLTMKHNHRQNSGL